MRLQLDELIGDTDDDRWLVMQDYAHEPSDAAVDDGRAPSGGAVHRRACSTCERSPACCDLPEGTGDLDRQLQPRGYRLLAKVPRLPEPVIDTSSAGSAPCRRSCGPPPTSSIDVEGVGRSGPGPSRRVWPAWPRASILDRYS